MGIVGVIPAAGKATRLDGLPKYLLPTGESFLLDTLCQRMKNAGVDRILIAANPENRGVIERYAPDECIVISINSRTMSETVLACQEFAGSNHVLFGMPDTWWQREEQLYKLLLDPLVKHKQPVSVAVWKARPEQTQKIGMVATATRKVDSRTILEITDVVDKPAKTDLTYGWGAMAWSVDFWKHINADDPHVGYAIQRALARGVMVEAIPCIGNYYDCGTRKEYFQAVRNFS